MAPYLDVDCFIEEGSVFPALQAETDEQDVNILQETRQKNQKQLQGWKINEREKSDRRHSACGNFSSYPDRV